MNQAPKVSIVVPAFNEEENIPLLMEKFAQMFGNCGFSGEVVLVDDGSTDGTLTQARECQKEFPFLKVVSHPTNRGLTDALQTGFKASDGEIFVFWPADLQYMPQDIPGLFYLQYPFPLDLRGKSARFELGQSLQKRDNRRDPGLAQGLAQIHGGHGQGKGVQNR